MSTPAKLGGIKFNPSAQYKRTGARIGTLAGTALVAYKTKPLRNYIKDDLDKIQIKHPQIKGNFTDIFKAFLKEGKNGKKGLYFLKIPKK